MCDRGHITGQLEGRWRKIAIRLIDPRLRIGIPQSICVDSNCSCKLTMASTTLCNRVIGVLNCRPHAAHFAIAERCPQACLMKVEARARTYLSRKILNREFLNSHLARNRDNHSFAFPKAKQKRKLVQTPVPAEFLSERLNTTPDKKPTGGTIRDWV